MHVSMLFLFSEAIKQVIKSCQIRSELLPISQSCLDAQTPIPTCDPCPLWLLRNSQFAFLRAGKAAKSKFCAGASGFLGGPSAYLISDLLHPNRVHLHRLLILFVLKQKYHFTVHHSYPDCLSYHMLHRSFGSSLLILGWPSFRRNLQKLCGCGCTERHHLASEWVGWWLADWHKESWTVKPDVVMQNLESLKYLHTTREKHRRLHLAPWHPCDNV